MAISRGSGEGNNKTSLADSRVLLLWRKKGIREESKLMVVEVLEKREQMTMMEPWVDIPGADVKVVTSDGRSIAVHSNFLASVSPVLEHMIHHNQHKKRINGTKSAAVVPIPGVPYDAVVVFLRCLYSSRSPAEGEVEKYGVHVLVLSHVMRLPWLKRSVALTLVLTTGNVVDMLKLGRLCDAPRLYVRSMNLIRRQFKAVEMTEGWKFVRHNDPWLELEVLEFLQEADKRDRRRRKLKKEQEVYTELSESMECLKHICTEGCTVVGPRDQATTPANKGVCRWGNKCEVLQQLIRHYATCERKKKPSMSDGGGCTRCSRMWHLLRLHSTICDQTETCKVPLCSKFKEREAERKKEDKDWIVLAKKVVSAKVISSVAKRKREDELHRTFNSKRP